MASSLVPSTLGQRKLSELFTKVSALQQTFKYWRELTNLGTKENSLAQHAHQIERLIGEPAGDLEMLRATLSRHVGELKAASEVTILDQAPVLERTALATHALWGYFLEKFGQRFDQNSRAFLAATNNLCWSCYMAAQEAASGKNEYPLVYLSTLWGPAILGQGRGWNPPGVGDVALQEDIEAVLQKLPISVISMPITGRGYPPDGIFVAHETGHAVEQDFALNAELQAAVRKTVSAKHRDEWQGWCSEMFADAWAIVHIGAAYVGALQDFLAPTSLGDGSSSSAVYPADRIRAALNREMLRQLDMKIEADACEASWLAADLGKVDDEWAADLFLVAQALLYTRLSAFKKTITELIPNTALRNTKARVLSYALEKRITEDDPRILFASLRFCHEKDPSLFASPKGPDILTRCMNALAPKPGQGPFGGARRGPATSEASFVEQTSPLFEFLLDAAKRRRRDESSTAASPRLN